jgi:hypothetical protein
MVASYLLNPGTRAHDARSIVFKALGKVMQENTAQTNLFGIDTKMLGARIIFIKPGSRTFKRRIKSRRQCGSVSKKWKWP